MPLKRFTAPFGNKFLRANITLIVLIALFIVASLFLRAPMSEPWSLQAGSFNKLGPKLDDNHAQGQRLCLLDKKHAKAINRITIAASADVKPDSSASLQLFLLSGGQPIANLKEIQSRTLKTYSIDLAKLAKHPQINWFFKPLSLLDDKSSELYLLLRTNNCSSNCRAQVYMDNYRGWECSNSDLYTLGKDGTVQLSKGPAHFYLEASFDELARPRLIFTNLPVYVIALIILLILLRNLDLIEGAADGFYRPLVLKWTKFSDSLNKKDKIKWIIILSAIYGLLLGYLAPPYQASVESAQVLAGTVAYPQISPHSIYHLKAWNITIQLAAVLLKIGLSEFFICKLISSFIYALFAVCLSTACYYSSSSLLLSLAVIPFFFFGGQWVRNVYPILFFSPHTYGLVGLAFALAPPLLFRNRKFNVASFLAGLSPMFHATIGAWTIIIHTICLFKFRREIKLTKIILWFLSGACLTTLSFGFQQLYFRYKLNDLPTSTHDYLLDFIKYYGSHFEGIDFSLPGLWMTALFCLAGAVILKRRKDSAWDKYYVLFLTVSGALSILLAFMQTYFYDLLPYNVNIFMFARLFLITQLGMAPVVIGELYRHRNGAMGQLAFFVIFCALILFNSKRTLLIPFVGSNFFSENSVVNFVFLSLATITLILLPFTAPNLLNWRNVLRRVNILIILLWLICAVPESLSVIHDMGQNRRMDYRNNTVLAKAAQGSGLMVLDEDGDSKIPFAQLRTSRPVAINTGLDEIYIAPESGSMLVDIMRDIYDWKWGTMLDRADLKNYWQNLTLKEWQTLRKKYGISDIICARCDDMHIPMTAETSNLRLFHIPEANSSKTGK